MKSSTSAGVSPPKIHERMRDVLAQLALADHSVGAVDYSRVRVDQGSGGHGSHRGNSAPQRVHSSAVEFAEHFSRLLDVAELELAQIRGTAPRPEPMPSRRPKPTLVATRKRRIVTSDLYRGRPDSFVAYVEGCSADLVRKARGERGLDSYGLPKPRVLTSREAVSA